MSYINAAGNLVLTANNAVRQSLAYILREEGSIAAEAEMFREGVDPTASKRSRRSVMNLSQVGASDVGALTDAPILAEVVVDGETNEIADIGAVFWFPDYAIRDPMAELARTGRVVFQREPQA